MGKFLGTVLASSLILSSCGQEDVLKVLSFGLEESQYPALDFSDPKKLYLNQSSSTFYIVSYRDVATILFLKDHVEFISENGDAICSQLSIEVRLSDSYYVNLGDCTGNGKLRLRIKDSFWEQFKPKDDGTTDASSTALVADLPQEVLSPVITIDNVKPILTVTDPTRRSINSSDEISFTLHYQDETLLQAVGLTVDHLAFQKEGDFECAVYEDTQSIFKITGADSESPVVSIHGCEGNGTFKLSIAKDVALDGASNGDDGGLSGLIEVDNSSPTLLVTSSANAKGYVKVRDILFRFKFSHSVSGFSKEDINIVYGTKGDFSVVSAEEYTLAVSADGEGYVLVDVPAGIAFDLSGNGNRAGDRNTVIYDGTKPRGSVGSVSPSIVKSSDTVSIPFVLTDERALSAVSLDSSKVSLATSTGVSCSSVAVTNPTSESPVVNLSQCSGDGTVTVSLLSGVASDLAGNATDEIASASFSVDNTYPTVSISSSVASGGYTNSGSHTFTFNFSESVSGFTADDVNLSNASKGTFTAVSGTQYTLTVTASAEGVISVNVPAGGAVDSASNSNIVASQYTIIYDISAPTVSIGAPSATFAKNGDPAVSYLVTFADDRSLASTQLTLTDITLNTTGGASCAVAVSGSGTTRTVSLTTCTGNGSVAISLASGTATDSAGNSAVASGASTGFTVDNTVPGISISSPSASIAKNGETVTYTVTYSDTNLSTIDLQAANVTVNSPGTAACSGKTIVDGATSTPDVQLSGCTGDGSISITVAAGRASDSAGNVDAGAGPSASFTVDNTGPSSHSISINGGATYTSSTSVTLTLAASDTNGVSQMFVSNSSSFASGSWEAYVTSKAWTLAQTNGTATVYVKFKDPVGNESTSVSDTVIHDNTGPSSHSISLDGGATYTSSTSVTLTLTASDTNGVSEMFVSNSDTFATGSWEAYATSKAWTLAQTNGTATVYVKFKDPAGNESTSVNDTIIHDNTGPSSHSISLDGGATYTSSTSVTLTLAASDTNGVSQMFVSNSDTFETGSWEAYATSKAWTLAQTNGTATVYVKFKDPAGNESTSVNDTIIHDNTGPSSHSISLDGGATYTSSTSVTLTLAASDTNGVSQMFVSNSATFASGSWEAFATSKAWTLAQTNGTATVYVKFKDPAGNESTSVSDTIIHDDTGPSSHSISIDAGATYTSSTSVTLTLAASDTNGVSQMFVSNSDTFASGSWETYATSKAWTLAQSNGTATVYVKFKDPVGNESTSVSDTIIHDDTGPSSHSISIDAGATYTSSTSVTLTLAASDTNGVSQMFVSNSDTFASGSWEAYATSKAWTLAQTNGTATVYVKFKDPVGNESTSVSDTIIHDSTGPSSHSIFIDAGATYTSSTSVTLTLAASDTNTVSQMFVSNSSSFATGSWEAYATSKAWVLAQTNGTATVYVKFKDQAGNESTSVSDTIIHDNTGPSSPSISIDGGATYTSSTSVTLTLSAADTNGVSQMFASNSATFASGSWEAFATSKAWTLGQSNGTATVYVKFKDPAGNESTSVSDTIIHDNTGPSSHSVSIDGGATYTSSTSVTLTLAASDTNGVSQMFASNSATFASGSWEAFATSKAWTLGQSNGTATVYVKFKDPAGNESTSVSDMIVHDNTGPSSHSVSIAGGATYTNTTSVTLTLAASDTNGVSQMFVSNSDTFATGSWETYATSKAWTLAQSNGTATVYVKFKDPAGNESTSVSDTIIHDNISPTTTITSSTVSNGGATTTSPVAYTVTFNESVTGFVSTEVTVGNGSLSGFAGSGTTYTFNVTPTAEGTVTVNVAGGVAADAAGNTNTAASQYSHTHRIYPTISSITTKYTEMNTTTSAIAFTISDNSTLNCSSSMSFASSNNSIVDGTDSQKYTFAGTAPNCTVTIVPASNAFGQVTITLTVTDSLSLTATSQFTLKVGYIAVTATHGNAQQWNDYIAYNYSTAPKAYYINDNNSTAAGTEARYHLIRHGGELKTVDYPYRTSCTGMSASDDNNVFTWVCDASGSNIVFYSTGLASGKYLSNLLTSAPAWDTKQVTIYEISTPKAKSDLEAWWTNTVTSLPDSTAGLAYLSSQSTIYVGTTDTTGRGFNINADKVGLVIMPGSTYRWDGDAIANFTKVNYGESGTTITMVGIDIQNYLWIEGAFNASPVSGTAANTVLYGKTASRSQFRNLTASNAASYGVSFARLSDANRFVDITISGSTSNGWYHLGNPFTDGEPHLYDINGYLIENAKFIRNGGGGYYTRGSNYFSFNKVYAHENTSEGIVLVDSVDTDIANSISSNNGGAGVYFQAFGGGSIVNLLSIGNGSNGLGDNWGSNPDANVFATTLANNTASGLSLAAEVHMNVNNMVAVNNGQFGINGAYPNFTSDPNYVTLSQVVSLQNEWHAIGIGTITGTNRFASDWKITNNLIIGPNKSDTTTRSGCLPFGSNIGFDANCAATGASNHTLRTGRDLTGAFVDKVTTNDSTNLSDTNGVATYSSSIDLVNFDNFYRTWTKESVNAFPSTDVRGRWTTGDGRIFDWALDKDVVTKYIYNTTFDGSSQNTAITTGICPTQLKGDAANTTTHRAHGTTVAQTYLTHAYERMFDEFGDDDAACESNEACIYMPNFGAYQGHGSLSSCTFEDGDTITGVTMYFYGTNGY